MGGPLEGIKVFDLTQWMVGPWGSTQLGALGADVIHIEMPDIAWNTLGAGVPPTINGTSIGYIAWNMNKRAMSLDLKLQEHRQKAYELLKTCDVFFANTRPGIPERLGMDYETIKQINPRIVYCLVTGWGETGPMRDDAGADTQVQYFTGLPSGTGVPEGHDEVYRHFTQVDGTTGNYCAMAILMALVARKRTGKGQLVELSMLRAASALQTVRIGEFLSSGMLPARLGNAAQSTAPDRAYFCSNKKYVGISITSETEWQAFCEVIGRPELAADSLYATNSDRVAHRKQLDAILEPIFASMPVDYWLMYLGRAGVPVGYQMAWQELRHHKQVLDNKYIVEVETAAWGLVSSGGPAFHLSKTPATWFGTPFPGQHDAEIDMEIAASRTSASATKQEA